MKLTQRMSFRTTVLIICLESTVFNTVAWTVIKSVSMCRNALKKEDIPLNQTWSQMKSERFFFFMFFKGLHLMNYSKEAFSNFSHQTICQWHDGSQQDSAEPVEPWAAPFTDVTHNSPSLSSLPVISRRSHWPCSRKALLRESVHVAVSVDR